MGLRGGAANAIVKAGYRCCAAMAVIVTVLSTVLQGCASRHYYDPPSSIPQTTPADRGLPFEELTLSGHDGVALNAWFLPAEGEAEATVVHFHGKGSTMGEQLSLVDWLPAAGFNLLMFDYRGFGKSEGRPTPKDIFRDSLAVLEHVRTHPGINPDRLVVFGQSLGGAIAITAVARGGSQGVRAVVTESALSSYRLVVRDHIGTMGFWSFLKGPLSWLVSNNRYSPDEVVDRLAPIPLLLIHGEDDPGVPAYHCRRLFERAGEPKQMWIVAGSRHLDTLDVAGEDYSERVLRFFRQALEGRRPSSQSARD